MSIINEDTKKYLENFVGRRFTEHDFVALLLPLLCQNGIYRINEGELEEKLWSYYKNNGFKELFQEIVPSRGINEKKLNLYDGLYREKYFGGSVWFDQLHSNILNLTYGKDIDLSIYEQSLSEDGKLKIRQMAQELATRYKAERNSKTKLKIFGFDPNCHYSLVYGNHIGSLLSFELITDGDIASIDYPDLTGMEHLFYESPLNPNEAIQLKNNRVAHVCIQNATYTIKQGLYNEKICYCNVNTQVLDEKRLQGIVNLANQKYEKAEYALTDEAPYVRKLVLK